MRKVMGLSSLLGVAAAGFPVPPPAIYNTSWFETFDQPVEVQGTLPKWIPHGSYVRQGPGLFDLGGRNVTVLLDGGAKITKLVFPGAGAAPRVSHAFVRGPLFKQSVKVNTICPFISLQPPSPPWTLEDQLKCGVPEKPGFANVDTWIYGEEMVAIADGMNRHHEVSRDCRSSTEYKLSKLNGNLEDQVVFNGAHPIKQVNNSNITLQLYTSVLGEKGNYHVHLAAIHKDDPHTRRPLMHADMPYAPVMHQFGATERYVVTVAPSMEMPVKMGAKVTWVPGAGSAVIVYDLHTMAATTFHTNETVMLSHHPNSWVENNRLYQTVVTYRDDCVYNGNQMTMTFLRNGSSRADVEACPAYLSRISTPLPSENADPSKSNVGPEGAVRIEKHSVTQNGKAITAEMPTINHKVTGKANRYFYAVSVPGDKTFKVDTRPAGSLPATPVAEVVHSYENGNHMSEPLFFPRPGATEEDDGALMLHEYVPGSGNASATSECDRAGCTHVVVLNAQTFEVLARMPLGFAVPAPLHALFFAGYE